MRKCAGLVLASPGIIASDSSAAQQFVRRGGRQTPNHTSDCVKTHRSPSTGLRANG